MGVRRQRGAEGECKGSLDRLSSLDQWKAKRQTQAQVHQLIHDYLYDEKTGLPVDVYTDEEVGALAERVYLHVYQQYEGDSESVYAADAG